MENKRDGRGRFAQGCVGGPGRPKAVTERAYLAIIKAACSEADWTKIARQAVKDAKEGDAAARNWLSGYLVGKPPTGETRSLGEFEDVADDELERARAGLIY